LDLTDTSSEAQLEELASKTAHVVNLAGILLRPGVDEATLDALHVQGTQRLMRCLSSSSSHPPTRVVHVSTTGVLGPTGSEPMDESAPPRPSNSYETTKLEGEQVALTWHGRGVGVVVVRPGLVYGPRDLHLLPLFHAIQRGTFRLIAGGRAQWQPIYAEDVAEAIARAAVQPGADGNILQVVGKETISVAAFSSKIAARLGTRVRGPSIPYLLALGGGSLLELICRPFGIEPPLSRSRARTMVQNRVYAGDSVESVLGFAPGRTLDDGLRDTISWYRSQGYLV
jgi:nucleoside-diphosphate-sugar epimerase